jgi:hypothetical protein
LLWATKLSGRVPVECVGCGKVIYKWPSHIKKTVRCSRNCSPATETRECARCGIEFTAFRSEKKKTCGRKCPALYVTLACEMCNGTFTVLKSRPSPRFCGEGCRLRWFSSSFGGNKSPHWKGGVNPNYYSAKRRAIMRRGDKIDHLVVFEAFNWECHICGQDIDPDLRFPHKMAATIDHIIPLSRGGEHTWDNVAPAHAMCNFTKSNRTEERA